MSFEKWEVARFPTHEQAEWRVRELKKDMERSPRGHIEYVARPTKEQSGEGWALKSVRRSDPKRVPGGGGKGPAVVE